MKSSHAAVVAIVAILAVVAIVAIAHQGQAKEPERETTTVKVGRVANGMVRTGIGTALTAGIPALIQGLRLSGIAG